MGTIRDQLSNEVGEVDWDGTVRNRYSQIVGRVSSSGEETDVTGRTVGYVKSDGTIYNRAWSYVGIVAISFIRDQSGRDVGTCDWSDSQIHVGGAALLLLLR